MEKIRKHFADKENIVVAVFFLITVIVACNPLISRYCIQGHDIDYHLLRIEALKEGILSGHPFAKVNLLFFGGAGYASSMFYSDLILYIPALLRVIGVSIGASYHIFVALCVILCYLTSYYAGYWITGSKYAGIAAAVMVTLSPYHIDDVLIRAAAGEYMAFIFVPLAVYGIYNVLYEDMSRPYAFGIGFAGLILSHPATLLMITVFCAVAFLIKIKTFLNNLNLLFKLIAVTAVTVCITSFYWLPMLEQFAATEFYVSDNWTDMMYSAVNLSQIFSNDFPTMGFILILIAVLRVFVSKKDDRRLDYADWMLVAGSIFMIGATNLLPWDKLARFLSFVQFPWRLFIASSVLFAIADAIIINALCQKLKEKDQGISYMPALVFAIFCAMTYMGLMHYSENAQGYYDYSGDYYSYKPYTANVIAGEWLPKSVTNASDLVDMSEHMYADDGTDIPFERVRGTITAHIDEEYAYVDVPFVYYKGYSATIASDNNGGETEVLIDGSGENGLCRVYPDDDMRGTLRVEYTGTRIQKASYVISIIALLVVVIIILKKRKKPTGSAAAILCVLLMCSLCGCAKADKIVNADVGTVVHNSDDPSYNGTEGSEEVDLGDPDEMMKILAVRDGTMTEEGLLYKGQSSDSERDAEEVSLQEIRVSGLGYGPDVSKQAVVVCKEPIYADEGMTFMIVDKEKGKAVYADSAAIYENEDLYYAVCDFTKCKTPGEYYLVTDKEAESEVFLLSGSVYEDVLDGYVSNIGELSLYGLGDMLLAKRLGCDEVSEEIDKAVLNRMGEPDEYTPADLYMTAALLACEGETDAAVEIYDEAIEADDTDKTAAEKNADDMSAKFWADCELYAATQKAEYEQAVKEAYEDVITCPEEPGVLYGVIAYISSTGKVDKKMSEEMVTALLARANELINMNMYADTTVLSDSETAAKYAELLMTANHISAGMEYRAKAQECINIANGCTPCDTVTGITPICFAISELNY